MMFFGGLWFIALLAALVWWLTSGRFGRPMEPPRREENALEIARQRYARGEISKEELDEIRKTLSGTAA